MTTSTSTISPNGSWRRNLAVCAAGSFTTIIGMTLILPILPLYVRALGVDDDGDVVAWSGLAYAATFLTAALTAPIWGRLGDRYGRKSMLIRASLGMAVAMSLMGLAQNVVQLVLLRLLVGVLGGYASGSTILVAAQTPKDRSAWALGVLSASIMAGNVVGPLIGGTLAQLIGVKDAFLATGALIFVAFLGTAALLREPARQPSAPRSDRRGVWSRVPNTPVVAALLCLSAVLVIATLSVEPVITEHVRDLTGTDRDLAIAAAVTFALTALGTVLSAPHLGRIADRVGHLRVLAVCLGGATVLLALQALAGDLWEFATLRFLTGVALGGITPTVVATLRHLVPPSIIGSVLGLNVSAQYVGQVAGPVLAGQLASVAGTTSVFVGTALVTALGLAATVAIQRRLSSPHRPEVRHAAGARR